MISSTEISTTQTITGSCHCKGIKYTISIPDSQQLPLPAFYCHCKTCRRTSGFHCLLLVSIPHESLTIENKELVCSYSTSQTLKPQVGDKSYEFCNECGTTLFHTIAESKGTKVHYQMKLVASTIDLGDGVKSLREIVKPEYHVFVGETWKGGVTRIMDDGLLRYVAGTESEYYRLDDLDVTNSLPDEDYDELVGECHCLGVRFLVSRPADDDDDAYVKEWTKPGPLGRKFCAGFCVCHSCRKTTGAPFWSWAFIPRKQITFVSEETLKDYASFKDSSRSVTRKFCANCGCHFFFVSSVTNDQMWDVAVGTLNQKKLEEEVWFAWSYDSSEIEGLGDDYIEGWKEKKMSFEVFGEEYCPELVEELRRGKQSFTDIY
ncbi:hypothetical protein HK098_001799 [Nowakowskiella sp. JEL0407]|nr:hypothetical protein HK098_001799 [Nowakowskiella sp. JEL0407]